MKKILALVLAMIMVLSMGVAFADDEITGVDGLASTAKSQALTLQKMYDLIGAKNTGLFPAEELTFKVSVPTNVTNPTGEMISVDTLTVTGNTNQVIYVNLPVYHEVGLYQYVINESAGNSQGVTYATSGIGVNVLVTYNNDHTALVSEIVLADYNDATAGDDVTANNQKGKVDTFCNTYNLGTLTVKKTVSGDLASTTQYFNIDVTFESAKPVNSDISINGGSFKGNPVSVPSDDWTKVEDEEKKVTYKQTVTISLKNEDTVTFTDIPDGVTYKVVEQAKHAETDTNKSDPSKGYTISYTGESGTVTTNNTSVAVVTNAKTSGGISTGMFLDNAPYMIIMALVLVGAAMMLKRRAYND